MALCVNHFDCLSISAVYLCWLCVGAGISQLPALLTLVRLYSAEVDLCNIDGMTPLMLAASFGDSILVNVSFSPLCIQCVFLF